MPLELHKPRECRLEPDFFFGLGKPVMASGSKLSHVESASNEKGPLGVLGIIIRYYYIIQLYPIKHLVIIKIIWR